MMILDLDYTVTFVNTDGAPKRVHQDEIVGTGRSTARGHPDDVARMKAYSSARRWGDPDVPSQYEFRFVDRSGGFRDAFLTIGMIPGTRQSIVSIMDMTEIKRMQRELEQSRRMAIMGGCPARGARGEKTLKKIRPVERLSSSLKLDDRQKSSSTASRTASKTS
jgi:hypothetical protein